MRRAVIVGIVCMVMGPAGTSANPDSADTEFARLRNAYLARYKPLWLESEAAWWEASTTGSDAAFARKKAADKALVELHSDRATLARLKEFQDGGRVGDPLLRRQLDIMYRTFLPGQADPDLRKRIVELESDVEQIFNVHRGMVKGKALSENDIRDILANTTDSAEAERAWKAYMEVGAKADQNLRRLVELRNKMAGQLGFANYYSMSLRLQEIDETELFRLFDELDALTREPFAHAKQMLDARMASRFGIAVAELRPWHYADLFFQDAPPAQEVNLSDLFKHADLVELSKRYYAGIGLPCGDILAHSDLYEKPGKCPHAFCSDLNREGDVRVLCNLRPNLYWADTLLHELGHGVYDLYIPRDMPFLLRRASHGITTEGIALMFGGMVKNTDWLLNVLGADPAKAVPLAAATRGTIRAEKILFSRWAQVMVRFEHGMYANPDQNLGKLWWDLKREYQSLNPPETVDRPDYAAKTHILTTPVYYHSYMMGELFAAQVQHYIEAKVLGLANPGEASFRDKPEVGTYLRGKVFGPGALYSWNELTEFATGEPLTPEYFVDRFVK